MAHIIQVGLGSGGMSVLDLVLKDPRITCCTLIEPDEFKPHNLQRHLFGADAVGKLKVDHAREWIINRRPDVKVNCIPALLQECQWEDLLSGEACGSVFGICAVDNEAAKYYWCSLMRKHQIPWTLGEVLSGGIGGFVHSFSPTGPCYGCVASYLKREGPKDSAPSKPMDYSQPEAGVEEMRISASFSSIMTIASMHCVKTLEMLDHQGGSQTILMPMKKVDGVFAHPWRGILFDIAKNPGCFFCGAGAGEIIDFDAMVRQKIQELSGGI